MTMKKNIDFKAMSIRLPMEIWKRLNLLRIEGKVSSIQEACIEALEKLIKRKEKEIK